MRSRGRSNHGAAANRRHAGQSDGSDNLSATVAADRAFPATVAELGSLGPMLHRPTTRVLVSLFRSVAFCWLDYLIQTRLPHAGPYSAFEDSWWYRALTGSFHQKVSVVFALHFMLPPRSLERQSFCT